MEPRISEDPFARTLSAETSDGRHDRSARSGQSRNMALGLVVFCAPMLALSPVFAADGATCSMVVQLLEATDRGLEAVSTGDARGATSGIAVFAQQAQHMADRYSQNDPLPDDVTAALAAMLAETATQHFIADAAPVLLEQALVIQQAMPDICAGTEAPDISRHAS